MIRGLLWLSLLAGLVYAPIEAWASYSCGHITIHPKNGSTVPTNFRILLERTEDAAGHLGGWRANLEAPSWLEEVGGAGEQIPLSVRELYAPHGIDVVEDPEAPLDHRRFTVRQGDEPDGLQVILGPERPLRSRTRYLFRTRDESLSRAIEEALYWHNQRYPERAITDFGWTTGEGPDRMTPVWIGGPISDGVEISESICPSHEYAIVQAPVLEESPFLFFRTRAVSGGGKVIEVLKISDGTLRFGYGACGVGNLAPGKYQVSVSALDLAGNIAHLRKPLEITVPGPVAFPRDEVEARPPPLRWVREPGEWQRPSLLEKLGMFVVLPFGTGFLMVALFMRLRQAAPRVEKAT